MAALENGFETAERFADGMRRGNDSVFGNDPDRKVTLNSRDWVDGNGWRHE
jgi:hypothetical protein